MNSVCGVVVAGKCLHAQTFRLLHRIYQIIQHLPCALRVYDFSLCFSLSLPSLLLPMRFHAHSRRRRRHFASNLLLLSASLIWSSFWFLHGIRAL